MTPGFLQKDSLKVAPLLLGWVLCRQLPEGVAKLKIVETEAYHQDDPASHSFRGLTKRTAPMFEAGGTIYVYFSYGMHYALNIVTGPKGQGQGVLLRAAEPLEGIEIMHRNRGVTDVKQLASGPGKLAQALGIKDTTLSGEKLLNMLSNFSPQPGSLWLEPPKAPIDPKQILTSPRVGVTKGAQMPWRFYLKDNLYVSKHPKHLG